MGEEQRRRRPQSHSTRGTDAPRAREQTETPGGRPTQRPGVGAQPTEPTASLWGRRSSGDGREVEPHRDTLTEMCSYTTRDWDGCTFQHQGASRGD